MCPLRLRLPLEERPTSVASAPTATFVDATTSRPTSNSEQPDVGDVLSPTVVDGGSEGHPLSRLRVRRLGADRAHRQRQENRLGATLP